MSNNSSISPTAVAFIPGHASLIWTCTFYIIFGTFGLIASSITCLVIITTKSLHTPCFILLGGGSVGSFTVAAHYFLRGFNKIRLEYGYIGYTRSVLECLLLDGVFGMWGLVFHSILSCVIAVDRLLSITVPTWYRHLGVRYAMGLLAACAVVAGVVEIMAFATAPLYKEMSCTEFNQGTNPTYFKFFATSNLAYCTTNVVIYVIMLGCFQYRLRAVGNVNDSFMKQQLAVIPTITLLAILYSITGILSEILITAKTLVPPGETAYVLQTIGSILKDASSLVEGSSLMIRNKKFRVGVRKIFCKKSTTAKVIDLSISAANSKASRRMTTNSAM